MAQRRGRKILSAASPGLGVENPFETADSSETLRFDAIVEPFSYSEAHRWKPSTKDVGFCVMALEEALARFSAPDVFDTDRDSQFTSFDFTAVLKDAEIRSSMDGRGCWTENVFIERL